MTIKEYYDSLEARPIPPKTALLQYIMTTCNVSKRTALRYVNEESVPSISDMNAISKYTGIAVEELFLTKKQ